MIKYWERAIWVGLLLVALMFAFNGQCSGTGDTIKVVNPKVKGTLRTGKPLVGKPIERPVSVPKTKEKYDVYRTDKGNNLQQLQSENERLNQLIWAERDQKFEAYKKLDSLGKIKFVSDLLQPTDVGQTLEDSIIKIDFSGKVIGQLFDVKLDYTRKSFTTEVEMKQYLILGGIEVGSNQLLDRFRIKGNVHYLSPSKTLITAGFDNQEIIYFGLSKKIFGHSRVIKK